MRLARSEKSYLTDWWFTVDRVVLTLGLLLLVLGIVMQLSASPSVALRRDLHAFYFVEKQVVFAIFGAAIMISVSLLSPANIRRLSFVLFCFSLIAMIAVLLVGPNINGAQRWLRFDSVSFQPSEILKPVFIVLTAWAFSEGLKRADVPAFRIAIIFYLICVLLLILQPDFGQTLLLTAAWVAMFFLAGLGWLWVFFFIGAGIAAIFLGYHYLPHVAFRINSFLDPSGENYQIARALEVFQKAGWFGRGPGEGSLAEQFLPDAHNDFIFAAIADEFGILVCLVLLCIFSIIVFLSLWRVRDLDDPFQRLGASGLMVLFALQAVINMSVNLGLIPAKGMTLPFLSYGGTSLLGSSLLLGMTLALTRQVTSSDRGMVAPYLR